MCLAGLGNRRCAATALARSARRRSAATDTADRSKRRCCREPSSESTALNTPAAPRISAQNAAAVSWPRLATMSLRRRLRVMAPRTVANQRARDAKQSSCTLPPAPFAGAIDRPQDPPSHRSATAASRTRPEPYPAPAGQANPRFEANPSSTSIQSPQYYLCRPGERGLASAPSPLGSLTETAAPDGMPHLHGGGHRPAARAGRRKA